MTKRNIALLCDYGLDDAAATMYLLRHADQFEKIDILPIAGNFPLVMSMGNARRLLHYGGEAVPNVRLVDTSSIPQPTEFLPDIHGEDGMGDLLPIDMTCNVAVLNYDEWIDSVDDSYTIVSLGPCTVTLEIMKRTNGAPSLIMMGGNLTQPPNYKGYEFNHGMNPDAYSKCAAYPHVVATLDSCHHPLLDFSCRSAASEDLLGQFINKYVALCRERKETGSYVYDLTATYYLVHPEKFTVETAQDNCGNTLSVLKYIADEPFLKGEV